MTRARPSALLGDENQVRTLLLGVFLAAMQTTLSTIVLVGYVARLLGDGSASFTDWRRLLEDGFRGFVVWLCWSTIPFAALVAWYQAYRFTTWSGSGYAPASTYLATILGLGTTSYESRIVFEGLFELFGGVVFQWMVGRPGVFFDQQAIASLEFLLLVVFVTTGVVALYLFPASFACVAEARSLRAAVGRNVFRTVLRSRYLLLWPLVVLTWTVGAVPEAVWLVWRRSPAVVSTVEYRVAYVDVPLEFDWFVVNELPVGVVPRPFGLLAVSTLLLVSALRFLSLVVGYAILRRAVRAPNEETEIVATPELGPVTDR
ncbi:DUF4013 domain-containing protein [Haloprofundus halobius]|uniref:DUF4013 domain-containing protein n=1 Tax=Haloprofundus halobius TaxID=2876194 RepID=UPI001CCA1E74|nr:DUF4013 domain-containing protein [Haloprofundus halobius]